MFEFYLSKKWAPGGYLWVFPKGKNKANIGVAISGYYAKDGKAAQKFLDEFLAWKYPKASVLTTVVGGIPIDKTVKQMVMNGLMLVGDAAHTVNPVTGGGIVPGMRSGLLAAETAVKALHNGGPARKKETIFRFTDDDLNRIADGISAVPADDRSLLKLFSIAVRKKPSLLFDVIRVFAGM